MKTLRRLGKYTIIVYIIYYYTLLSAWQYTTRTRILLDFIQRIADSNPSNIFS